MIINLDNTYSPFLSKYYNRKIRTFPPLDRYPRSVSFSRSGSLSCRKMLSMLRLITSYSLTCFFQLPIVRIVSVFIGIYLPIQYKFGYEKTKFAFGVIIMASPFILPLLMRAGSLNLNFLSMFSPYLVYGGIVLIGFAILAISAFLSIKIYDKADLA